MKKAIVATYCHTSSMVEGLCHKCCPTRITSWCKFNRAATAGEPILLHKHSLSVHVWDAFFFFFNTYKCLPSRELERCQQGKTQNLMEPLNNTIWLIQSNNQLASRMNAETALAEPACRFNAECKKMSWTVVSWLEFSQGSCPLKRAAENDSQCLKTANKLDDNSTRKARTAPKLKESLPPDAKDYSTGGFGLFQIVFAAYHKINLKVDFPSFHCSCSYCNSCQPHSIINGNTSYSVCCSWLQRHSECHKALDFSLYN